jgi:hypothetical protein
MKSNCYNCEDSGLDTSGDFCHCLDNANYNNYHLETVRRLRTKFRNEEVLSEHLYKVQNLNLMCNYFGSKLPDWLRQEFYNNLLHQKIIRLDYLYIENHIEFIIYYNSGSALPLKLNNSLLEEYIKKRTLEDIIT